MSRVGVVLLVPDPVASEVDALRRAVGDPALGRIPAHVTLVPPVNVRADRLADAVTVLRTAAAASGPLHLTLGPVTTFLPANPVLYLAVGGDTEALHQLRDRVFTPPLDRPLTWPFVPHVTVADDSPTDRIEAAVTALADYRAEVTIDRVHLLEEQPGRAWVPIADAAFRRPAVVGRGGLPLELSVTERVDPTARDQVIRARTIAVTARRDNDVVGIAEALVDDAAATASVVTLAVVAEHRGQGIGGHLLAFLRSAAAEAGYQLSEPALGRPFS